MSICKKHYDEKLRLHPSTFRRAPAIGKIGFLEGNYQYCGIKSDLKCHKYPSSGMRKGFMLRNCNETAPRKGVTLIVIAIDMSVFCKQCRPRSDSVPI